jgi:hypothetical protein
MVKYIVLQPMKINNYLTQTKKKRVLISIALLIMVISIYLLAAANYRLFPFASRQQNFKQGEYIVNLDRTETEKEATKKLEENPQSKTENTQTDTPSSPPTDATSGKQQVNVLLTNVSVVEDTVKASGFVTNISETGGSCEYVFTSGAQTIRKKVETMANPTSTTCKTTSFATSELPVKGTWTVELMYESDGAQGKSNSKEFVY